MPIDPSVLDELDAEALRRHEDYRHLHRLLDEFEAAGQPIPLDSIGIQAGWSHTGPRQGRQGLATVLRLARRAGFQIVKDSPRGDARHYHLHIPGRPTWDHLGQVYAGAELTCDRVQVGTKTVEREEIIRPAETRTVTVEEPVYEWRCGPVLSDRIGPEVFDDRPRGSADDPDRDDDR